ncbi:MAG: hypothetical protein IJ661_06225 [Lachnospiraceae bacterium]|nr:hypothetical protein [Lachnospiraceae bacterium]
MNCKKYIYTIEQNEITIEHFIKRYYFDEKDRELLLATGRFLSELNTVESWIAYNDDGVVCTATLGDKYDRLLDVVAESQHLLLAYSMECFAMEFLSKTYEKMNETVFQETGKWMGEYHFLGEEDIKDIEGYLDEIRQSGYAERAVSWENGMLHPLKSVIFTAEYRGKREESGCHSCELCDNVTCSFRQVVQKPPRRKNKVEVDVSNTVYSYGIAHIFGKQGEK